MKTPTSPSRCSERKFAHFQITKVLFLAPLIAFLATASNAADIPEFLNPLAKPAKPVPAFTKGFKIDRDQTIVIFGGANAAECQRNGWLELRLVASHPQHRVHLRNMAWPTDTVFSQPRPRNFFGHTDPEYGEKDGRQPIAADIALLWFGQMESLAGKAGLPDFVAAYETMIAQLSAFTGRIVLVTPVPFSDPLALGLDLKQRNEDLQRYAAAIRQLAGKRNLPLVDLTASLAGKVVTSDGALLSAAGHEIAATQFARQLGFAGSLPHFADYIRENIREKNAIWRRYWLPSNWAFLYGNRQSQPSSRDHEDSSQRWFPKELDQFLAETRDRETEIWKKVQPQEQ